MLTAALALMLIAAPSYQPPKPAAPVAGKPADTGPSAALIVKLRRGVNLSHWWQGASAPAGDAERSVSADDIALLKASGITHVRIPLDPARLLEGSGRLNQAATMDLTRSIQRLHAVGVAT